MEITRSYLICAVQRTGSHLLGYALQDTGVAGHPDEHLLNADQPGFLNDRGIAGGWINFLVWLQEYGSSANGVWGANIMWNYFAQTLDLLRSIDSRWRQLEDDELLQAAFPNLRYVWLRREDKLRQAISWWRAAVSGQFSSLEASGVERAPQPPFDFAYVDNLFKLAIEHEAGWRAWFAAHNIRPIEVVYEDLVGRYDIVVNDVLKYLDVSLPPTFQLPEPRLRQQADAKTAEYVAAYHRKLQMDRERRA